MKPLRLDKGVFCLVLSTDEPAALVFPVPSLNITQILSRHKAKVKATPTKPWHIHIPHRRGGLFVMFFNEGLRAWSLTSQLQREP